MKKKAEEEEEEEEQKARGEKGRKTFCANLHCSFRMKFLDGVPCHSMKEAKIRRKEEEEEEEESDWRQEKDEGEKEERGEEKKNKNKNKKEEQEEEEVSGSREEEKVSTFTYHRRSEMLEHHTDILVAFSDCQRKGKNKSTQSAFRRSHCADLPNL
jgi:hypothetical protein